MKLEVVKAVVSMLKTLVAKNKFRVIAFFHRQICFHWKHPKCWLGCKYREVQEMISFFQSCEWGQLRSAINCQNTFDWRIHFRSDLQKLDQTDISSHSAEFFVEHAMSYVEVRGWRRLVLLGMFKTQWNHLITRYPKILQMVILGEPTFTVK